MTPFGIRKRIKSLLGFGTTTKAPTQSRPKYSVTFELPSGETYQVDAKEGDSLVLASGRGAYPISTGCSDCTCATCRVVVIEGHDQLSSPSTQETQTKAENDVSDDLRLGCQTAVLGEGIHVKIINVLGEELVE
jgi:ferredoxin